MFIHNFFHISLESFSFNNWIRPSYKLRYVFMQNNFNILRLTWLQTALIGFDNELINSRCFKLNFQIGTLKTMGKLFLLFILKTVVKCSLG